MTREIAAPDYTNVAQDLLARAAKHGATAADVMVADGETLSVQVRMGAVDRLTKAREKRLGLRVFSADAPPVPRPPIFLPTLSIGS